MTDREDQLGRILSTLLMEEMEAMKVDTNRAAGRLEDEMNRSNQRRRFTAAAAAGVAAAAVVAGLVLWNQTDDATTPAPFDRGDSTDVSAAPYLLDLSSGQETPLSDLVPESVADADFTYSPDGMRVAIGCDVVTCPEAGGLQVVDSDGSTTVVPVPEGSSAERFVWSRDATRLIYLQSESSAPPDLYVYDLSQGESTKVVEFGLGYAYWIDIRADFSPDGETVVFHIPRGVNEASKLDVWTVPVTGGEPTLVRRNAAQPKYLSDGRIAFVQPGSNSLLGGVIVVTTASGPPQTLVELPEEVIEWLPSPDGTRALASFADRQALVDLATGELTELGGVSGQWAGNDTLLADPPTS